MKTIKIGRFATLHVCSGASKSHGSNASSVNNKEENKMFNKSQMSHDAQAKNKEENKMKTAVKGKLRFFKEFTSVIAHSAKAGWNEEEFDVEAFVEEKGYDSLLVKEESRVKSAEDTSKAERKEEKLKDFHDSLGESSESKKAEVEPTPVKEEEESAVEETVVDETAETEETPEVTEETEVTEEETPAGGKVRPIPMKVGKLFNYVGKFWAVGIRRVKGGYQWAKGKVLGLAGKTSFRKNISANAKMLSAGILAMYSGLILGIESVYAFGLLTMILSLRVVLPVVIVIGLIELFVFGLGKYNSYIVRETLSSLKGMFAEENREEEANA